MEEQWIEDQWIEEQFSTNGRYTPPRYVPAEYIPGRYIPGGYIPGWYILGWFASGQTMPGGEEPSTLSNVYILSTLSFTFRHAIAFVACSLLLYLHVPFGILPIPSALAALLSTLLTLIATYHLAVSGSLAWLLLALITTLAVAYTTEESWQEGWIPTNVAWNYLLIVCGCACKVIAWVLGLVF